jgi:site-specific DNA-methyltransferase (adenine-specific)
MGQNWDGGDIAFRPETWRLVFDVLKPGAYIVAFSSSRTFARMAVAIEDAGFITHPMIGWLFGTGFPKAHRLDLPDTDHLRYGAQTLKPALEPIYVGQKPMDGTGTANWLVHGIGAMNIDACRIPTTDALGGGDQSAVPKGRLDGWDRPWMHDAAAKAAHADRINGGVAKAQELGRWPANLVHDGSPEVLEAFEAFGERPGANGPISGDEPSSKTDAVYGQFGGRTATSPRGDAGSAARFFFSAKAQPDDHFGSKHPTIKPVALIKWLADLVLPQGARLIDPFAGTGPIVFARPDLDMTLIEREAEYVADIQRRIAHVEGGGLLRSQEIARRKGAKPEPLPADGLFGWPGPGAAA